MGFCLMLKREQTDRTQPLNLRRATVHRDQLQPLSPRMMPDRICQRSFMPDPLFSDSRLILRLA